jgi:hypothetical protein
MSDPLKEATAIVSEKASIENFLMTYEPGDNPVSRILVWDHHIMCIGHSKNQAACVAISSVLQTMAAIARSLRCAERVDKYKTDNKAQEPVYEIVLIQGKRSRKIIAATVASLAGVARTAEAGKEAGSVMQLSDHRKMIPDAESATSPRS